jgi:hypothetical protein
MEKTEKMAKRQKMVSLVLDKSSLFMICSPLVLLDAKALFSLRQGLLSQMVSVPSQVALTVMGRPLFKAPDGGYFEIIRVTGDSTQRGLQQGPEISVLVEEKVRPEAFPSGLPMSVWSKIYATFGLLYEPLNGAGLTDLLEKRPFP